MIISETVPNEFGLKLADKNLPVIGSAVEGQNLKIVSTINDLQLKIRLDNNKWLSFDSNALVCADLDDPINIGITTMKKIEMSVQYSVSGPAVSTFRNGKKQAVAKIESLPTCEDKKYYDFSIYPKVKSPLFAKTRTWIPPLSNLYVNVSSRQKPSPFAMKTLRCKEDTQIKYLPGPVPT